MTLVTVPTLVDALHQLQILDAAQFRQLSPLPEDLADPRILARQLLDRGWLTPFQINHLLQGKGQELLLGSYLLQERLGEGGTGQVYKALHQRMRRVVALKVIRKELLTDAEVLARFYREIQVASQVAHPNVVHAYDAGPIGDRHFLAMEYVKGIDLARLVKENGVLRVDQACDYIRQAALGLQHICDHGLVHRDIKPSNLLVMGEEWQLKGKEPPAELASSSSSATHSALLSTRWGLVKILDLGLARFQRHVDGELTGTFTPVGGAMMGTPDYMAPEQALDFHRADIRSDIYSLGCTLFYLLTGQPPFPGGTLAQKLLWHQQSPPPPVHDKRPEVPDALLPILERMLAKRPEDRFQLPGELAHALEWPLDPARLPAQNPAAVESQAIPTAIPLDPEVLPAAVPLEAAITAEAPPLSPAQVPAALSLEAAPASLSSILAVEPVARPESESLTAILKDIPPDPAASEARVEPGRFSPRSWKVWLGGAAAFLALSCLGFVLYLTRASSSGPGKELRSFSWLDKLDPGQIPAEERFPWQPPELVAVLGQHRQRHWGLVQTVAFTANGKQVISFGTDRVVRFWDAASGRQKAAYPGQKSWIAPVVSPDGRTVLAGSLDQTVRLWDLAKGQEVRTFRGHSGPIETVAFGSDDKTLASVSRDGTIKVWDGSAAKERVSIRRDPQATYSQVTISPNNKLLLHSGGNFALRVWDLEAGKECCVYRQHKNVVTSAGFSADSKQVISTSQDRTVRIWEATTGKDRFTVQADNGFPLVAGLAPDGKTLAIGSPDGSVWLWDVAGNKERAVLRGHVRPVISLDFAADGQVLASGSLDGSVRLWETATGKERGPLLGHPAGVHGLALSPDKKLLASVSVDSTVRLWNLTTAKDAGVIITAPPIPMPRERPISAITFLPGQEAGLVTGQRDGSLRLWDPATGKQQRIIWQRAGANVLTVASSASGKFLAVGLADSTVKVLGAVTGTEQATLQGHKGPITALGIAPDDRTIASASVDGSVRLWETTTGKYLATLQANVDLVTTLAFSADGLTVASAGGEDRFVHLWDVARGKTKGTLSGHADRVLCVVFAATGHLLASTGADGRVIIWDAETQGKLHEWQFPGPVWQALFAPDGRHLFVGNSNSTIYVLRLNLPSAK